MMNKTTRAPCPRCDRGPRDRALAITTDEHGTVAYCHRCSYVEVNNAPTSGRAPSPVVERAKALDWSDVAESIWRRTLPLRGSLGETYLLHRSCALPPPDSDLRY